MDRGNKDPAHVERGLRSALNNPRVSEEAKERDREILEKEFKDDTSQGGKDPDHVARGLKAAIHNPNVSEQAKEHDRQRLEQMGEGMAD
ncbi:Conidiation protein 6-domain-containing protein [Phialemonium atrogriseum]|uniref:Conidiation protein 6-domain-containing protein n=1 Tax=Phialemonium atrogriseum TaxID=1093897 RepID=A0AAJ0C0T5_9PEZI|nr:Conidiation protein 6-domain-containing protein [Phialemonium atrogriseum]KAK1768050.1 Conidiation protein 6-domain-containing protein [Phialemonium atrogriseum]